eukprot:TRINITY_DN6127_c0_g1_i2.p1 TRINITY_DN6127_c0_g1~~TRINITY_DN6127_c0_g1_i2.p1  ORF type:complete len:188 (+),score=27.47 TRINITY_DN6127_c0_g1_i2:96-659(+)
MSSASVRVPLAPTLLERANGILPLSKTHHLLRIVAHLSILILPFAWLKAETLRKQTLLLVIWAAIISIFILVFVSQVVVARRKLLYAARSSSQGRALSQSAKLLKLLCCFTLILLILCVDVIRRYFTQVASRNGNARREVLTEPCNFGCVIGTAFFDILALVGVYVVFHFFFATAPPKEPHGMKPVP